MLRIVNDSANSDAAEISSSSETAHSQVTQTRLQITSGDGELGHGGTHQRVVTNRTMEDNDSALVLPGRWRTANTFFQRALYNSGGGL